MLAEDFDGDETIEGLLVRLVDDPHAAATELGNDPVMTDTVHHRMLLFADAEGVDVFDLTSLDASTGLGLNTLGHGPV